MFYDNLNALCYVWHHLNFQSIDDHFYELCTPLFGLSHHHWPTLRLFLESLPKRKWKLKTRRAYMSLMSIIVNEMLAAYISIISAQRKMCSISHCEAADDLEWKSRVCPIHFSKKKLHNWPTMALTLLSLRSCSSPNRPCRCCCCWSKLIGRSRQQRGESTTRKLSHNWLIDWLAFVWCGEKD